MKYFKLLIIFILVLESCSNKNFNKDIAANYLVEKGWVEDHTIDIKIKEVLEGINMMAFQKINKQFVLEDKYNPTDSGQILIIPFRKKNGIGTISAFSSIENRLVFVCPLQIKEFIVSNSLSDSADMSGILGIILLHELCHFSLRISGSFDENLEAPKKQTSELGELDMGTEPVLMTSQKRLELNVDSLAIEMVKKGIRNTEGNCFNTCLNIELALGGAEFMLFGKRTIEEFGNSKPKMIHDKSWSHPNIELRLAFMNYYLNPTLEKLNQIDNYLYQREVEPIHRQETDVRIYQDERESIK